MDDDQQTAADGYKAFLEDHRLSMRYQKSDTPKKLNLIDAQTEYSPRLEQESYYLMRTMKKESRIKQMQRDRVHYNKFGEPIDPKAPHSVNIRKLYKPLFQIFIDLLMIPVLFY